MVTRSPICTVVGHVDHGKSSLLDKIRGSAIVKGEAGGITQAIGASKIPLQTIEKICGPLLKTTNTKLSIPGLLFIDTPGHAAFNNLRKRGGNLADIAILVIDMNEGFKPQTVEALEILKAHKTPFVIAANKIDLIPGWKPNIGISLIKNISSQHPDTIQKFENKMYEIVGKMSEYNLNSERFDRVDDFTKQIAIIPLSSLTGEGIPELLMIISGLAQKYLEQCLKCNISGFAKGTILEVKEEKGLGTTVDVILYDGHLKINDIIVIGSVKEPIVSKVRALLEAEPLTEMRDKKGRFKSVKEVYAATGVKIAAQDLSNVYGGMPIVSTTEENLKQAKEDVQKEVGEVIIETQENGVIIKADTLGSLEALTFLLKERSIPISSASVGNITKKDICEGELCLNKNSLQGFILGFNVKAPEEVLTFASSKEITIILNDVIYRLVEDFEKSVSEKKKKLEEKELDGLVRPCKIHLIPGYVFRQNNPAVVGVEILTGKLKTSDPVMNSKGIAISSIKEIQMEQVNLSRVESGKQVAISMDNVTVGRQVKEGDTLYTDIPEEDFKKMKKYKAHLSQKEIELLKEIAAIKRENNPVWGV